MTENKFGKDSIEIALVYLDFSKVYSKKKDLDESIKYQKWAIDNFRTSDYDPEKWAEACIACSELLVKNNQVDEGLSYLKEAEDIYECTYGLVDKKTCKIKWDIALLLLKASKYNEALDEVLAVEE